MNSLRKSPPRLPITPLAPALANRCTFSALLQPLNWSPPLSITAILPVGSARRGSAARRV